MLSLETGISFFGIATLLALAPGPDNIFVLTQATLYGWRAGIFIVFGLCTGLVGHTLAVTLGLATLLAASPALFFVIKLLGAGYLVYLAWGSWQVSAQASQATRTPIANARAVAMAAPTPRLRALYRRGIIMNLSNPKVTLFFLALLPQFIQPGRQVSLQIITLGLLFMLATLLVFGSLSMTAGWFGKRLLQTPRSQRIMHQVAALIFVLLAIKIVI